MQSSEQIRKPRLELVWINKDKRPKLEPRILHDDPDRSYPRHASGYENRLIFGDNLLALKALEQEFGGKVKCCFIDPPYNTGSAFEQYDDGLEHSLWLGLMRDRLELIRNLLTLDGSLWIAIDDNEAHYLKVMCDEIFGRRNFVANVVWQKRTLPDARLRLGGAHDHVLVYAKDLARLAFNRIRRSDSQRKAFKNPDADPRGPWASSDYSAQGFRPNQMYEIVTPGGAAYRPAVGTCWKNTEEVFRELVAENRIWFGKDQLGVPRRKTFLSEHEDVTSWSWWENEEVGHNQEAKKESIALFGADNAFATPKPERLVKRILEIATCTGDLVLDSFAGSGTTGAVAHKMGRRWIMVELGAHCHSHILPRLRKVIDGTDDGGVTRSTGWKGGGSFQYCRLAPSLFEYDAHGRHVLSPLFDDEMLIEAVCKALGFTRMPRDTTYWRHGFSTERDFIYVTRRELSACDLRQLSEEVGPGNTLRVMCSAFNWPATGRLDNLDVRKITRELVQHFDMGCDNYSFALASGNGVQADEI
ncbi:site-specific DNA-methyltransferase [Aminobacter sp. AP02]|uniref:site-specific DNA-methyltransferase n=1 Tax=Aminobacter sp. AP02 TaxID=2135737 RepID=UPI000D6AC79C|nr:site-specific DNA-methyltransferase [Aminobacter sp. AP02]PWK76305.1 adenine-specific DNA-methyltransferase [Aminobacter sp. AP02]